MHPNESRSGRRASSEPIEPADLMPDLEGPDFAVWADSDGSPPGPATPVLVGAGTAGGVSGRCGHPRRPCPRLIRCVRSPTQRSGAEQAALPRFLRPAASGFGPTGHIDAPLPDDGRRVRLREWAAQLWAEAPRGRAEAGKPHLICTLDEAEFALPLAGVLEVQRLPPVTPAPHLPDWLLGVTNRRG